MKFMFANAAAFNQPLSFDTSGVTSMDEMFDYTDSLSDENKVLIRCAWEGVSAFDDEYGSKWGKLAACPSFSPSPPPSPPSPLSPPSPPPSPSTPPPSTLPPSPPPPPTSPPPPSPSPPCTPHYALPV